MAQARDAQGRFTSGGGGTKLGSAYGQVVIDASGVTSGVNTAVKALNGMGGALKSGVIAAATAVGVAGTAAVGAFAAVVASGVKMSSQLEAQMSGVKAVMQITDQQVSMLREHILDLGVDPNLKVSAMEAAAAVEMLGRNGLSTSQILEGAARSTILLQNATGSDFAQAADIATDVMALFNIAAGNMETAVDGITSVVNNSKFSITDYQYALAQAGGVASTSGVSFDDLNTSIAAIAPLFSDGSSAGAGLKTMLQRLAAPTGEMKQIMSELGLVTADGTNAFYDAQGNMRSMSDIARALNDRLGGLSEQQRSHALPFCWQPGR
ncbi:MAG: phage tail tape measure protein [Chloroflexi bacterium]|nr:phage tail tape measure protein [Chloroflexota bacterium]